MPYLLFSVLPLVCVSSVGDGYTLPKWMFVYGVSLLGVSVLLLQGKSTQFPALGRDVALLVLVFIVIATCSLWQSKPTVYLQVLLDRFSFVILVYSFYRIYFDHPDPLRSVSRALLLPSLLVAGYGIWQIAKTNFSSGFPYFEIASTFGHSNMTAQFLGFAVIFHTHRLLFKKPSRAENLFLQISIGLSSSYIYFSFCRSVWIGLMISFVFLLYRTGKGTVFELSRPFLI